MDCVGFILIKLIMSLDESRGIVLLLGLKRRSGGVDHNVVWRIIVLQFGIFVDKLELCCFVDKVNINFVIGS